MDPSTGIAHTIARKNILELQPYRCARDDYSEGILLDANENAFGPTSLPTKNLDPYDNSNNLERYPDPYQMALKEVYAKYRGHGLTPANIFVGVGSDEAIDLLMRIFCQPAQDEILITPPTYGMYKVCAKVNDVAINAVPLTEDFDLQVPEVRFVLIIGTSNPRLWMLLGTYQMAAAHEFCTVFLSTSCRPDDCSSL
jgi:histidinol-phosphate aminotransferase